MQAQIYNAYSQNQVGAEVSPQKLIEMLYEGLLRFCARIKVFIKKDDIEQRLYYTKRASAIFIELINCLDYERGGDVAYYLNGLYVQELKLLSQANLRNDESKVDEVINVVRCLLEAWREIHPDLQANLASENPNKNSSEKAGNSDLQANLASENPNKNSSEKAGNSDENFTASSLENPQNSSTENSNANPQNSSAENSNANLSENLKQNLAQNAQNSQNLNPTQNAEIPQNAQNSQNSNPAQNAEIPQNTEIQSDLDENLAKLNSARNAPKPEKPEDTSYEDMLLKMNAMRAVQ